MNLLTARVGSRRTVGQYVCGDLSCFRFDAEDAGAQESGDVVLNRVERAFDRMYELFSLRLA